ncbi:MAG: universal stress protein [Bacteroidetes bacterium]|nr:universal stress protein [Bacteroidota bacterium]
MKKILFLSDAENFPKGAMRFVRLLHESEHFLVKGIFYSPIGFEQVLPVGFPPTPPLYVVDRLEEVKALKESKEQFMHQCENRGIRFRVDEKEEVWDKDRFAKESRFADLVIIGEQFFSSSFFTGRPNYFLEEVLHFSECPVIVVPEAFENISRLAIAYDGKKESMFALKQLTNLLPDFADLPCEIVYIKNDKKSDIPDIDLLKEYASAHFDCLAERKLNFENKYFATWLEEKRNVMLITGSYSRSTISNLLKQSFTDGIIRDSTCPIFIAHTV